MEHQSLFNEHLQSEYPVNILVEIAALADLYDMIRQR